ncbi:MAG: RDD family protein [Clostridia bacterium]|nr:RDD family protein [Clostridia bacterium]
MSISLQKGSFWKRISAYLFDLILTVIVTVGVATAVSAIVKYDNYSKELETHYTKYETLYNTDFDMTEEDYNALSETEKANYQAASEAFGKDPAVKAVYAKMFSLTLVILSVSLFVSITLIYFVVPLLFKNGQTLGKKIFGLAVMRTNCVKLTNPILFVRSILGLYTIETMVPVLIVTMIYFGVMGIVGTMTLFLLLGLQVVVMAVTQTNSSIHDLLSDTVVVDMSSQEIFESQEELIAYKEAMQAREAAKAEAEYVPSTFLQSVQAMQNEKAENENVVEEANDNNGLNSSN